MLVTIEHCTEDPIDQISKAAGTSYGRDDSSLKRVKHCYKNGHMSVFEFADVTFKIDGISRACSHQLVRHRFFSFVQSSLRYTTIEGDDWYVMPPAFDECTAFQNWFIDTIDDCRAAYEDAIKHGIKPEDARFLLPQATKTTLSAKTNVRELFHFFGLRCAHDAQWEIRDLANAMLDACKGINDQWKQVIELWDGERVR